VGHKRYQLQVFFTVQALIYIFFFYSDTVTDKKGLSQPACPKEWKKYEERNE
jgi:hypothetical protein